MFFKPIFLLLAVYFIFKLFLAPRKVSSGYKGPGAKDGHLPEVLVSCRVCGTFFQGSHGVMVGGQVVCSSNCAKKI